MYIRGWSVVTFPPVCSGRGTSIPLRHAPALPRLCWRELKWYFTLKWIENEQWWIKSWGLLVGALNIRGGMAAPLFRPWLYCLLPVGEATVWSQMKLGAYEKMGRSIGVWPWTDIELCGADVSLGHWSDEVKLGGWEVRKEVSHALPVSVQIHVTFWVLNWRNTDACICLSVLLHIRVPF